jgi:hypothetical protein
MWRKAERDLSDAYLRLRSLIPNACNTPHAPSHEVVWQHTEECLKAALTTTQSGAGAQGAYECPHGCIIDPPDLDCSVCQKERGRAPSPSSEAAPHLADSLSVLLFGTSPCGSDGPERKGKDAAILRIVSAACQAGERAGREQMREEAATCALEQRCERGTPWDLACTTIAEHIRRLAPDTEK